MRLGDNRDPSMQELSDVIAALSAAAQAGDSKVFREMLARLVALVGQERLESTGVQPVEPEVFRRRQTVAGPNEPVFKNAGDRRKALGTLGAVDLVAAAALDVVRKADSPSDYVAGGVQGDKMLSMALAVGSEAIAKAAGLDYADALEVVSKSMADAAGVDVREIADANARASAGTSRAYWQRAWDVAHD